MRLFSRADFEDGLQGWLHSASTPAHDQINAAGVRIVHPADWQLRQEPFTKHFWIERLNKVVIDGREERTRLGTGDKADNVGSDEDGMHSNLKALVEDQDESTVVVSSSPTTDITYFSVDFYVAYSPVYGVPVLYFRGRNSSGSVLPLDALVESSLFNVSKEQYPLKQSTDAPSLASNGLVHAHTEDEQAERGGLPAITQGEHPETGLPCFYLHPCETSAVLQEIARQIEDTRVTPLKMMQSWFMLISTLINVKQ